MTTAPPPIKPAAVPAEALPKRPIRTIASPAMPSSTETTAKITLRRRVAGGVKACRAAIGGTRVERSAGTIEASTVTTIPTSSETTTVRDCTTRLVVGRSIPNASSRALSKRAISRPPAMPTIAPSNPISSASTMTELRI